MREVKVITDSCADLTGELLKEYDIDYVKMSTILDGVEAPALLTWSPEEVHGFYETMRSGKRITTAQVPVEEFTEVFTRYLKEGYDIVYIACSAKQTGSVNTGRVVAKNLLEEYPDRKIFCIDSLNATMGEGMLAIKAAQMQREGYGAEMIYENIMKIRNNVLEFATVHTLDYLKRAGRVSGSSAFFGNLMGVKPILISDAAGAQAAYKKVKGRANSMKEIVDLLKENITDPEQQTIYLMHADCAAEEVELLRGMIADEIPCADIYVSYIGPIVGASVGPDCVAVFGFGKEVTFTAQE